MPFNPDERQTVSSLSLAQPHHLLTHGLLLVGAAVFIFGFIFGRYDEDRIHRSPRWARMLSSACLVGCALVWWLAGARSTSLGPYGRFIFLGMLCSFLGDLILAEVIPLPQRVIFGIVVFAVAHVFYISGYAKTAGVLGLDSRPVWIGALVATWVVAAVVWWTLIRAPGGDPALGYGSLVYALVLGTMVGATVALAVQQPHFVPLTLGAVLFLVSDAILGNRLLRGNNWFLVGDVVWALYISGQALIVFSVAAALRLV